MYGEDTMEGKHRFSPAKSVLVVDDSQTGREVLREVIEFTFPDWQIIEAANGWDGVVAARNQHPDLIITDFNMPVMNGYEMAVTLRRMPETSHIPMVMLTSENSRSKKVGLLRNLCQAALHKPISLADLHQTLEQFNTPSFTHSESSPTETVYHRTPLHAKPA